MTKDVEQDLHTASELRSVVQFQVDHFQEGEA